MSDQDKRIYLVVLDIGGLYGAYMDGAFADRMARAVDGVVCAVPVIADYRPFQERRTRDKRS